VLYIIAVAIVAGSHPREPATGIFIIIGFTVLFTGATILAEQVLHSRGRFGYAAAAHLTLALTQLGGTAAAHALGGGVLAISVMIVAGNLAYLAVILLGVRRSGVHVRLKLRPVLWPRVLRQSAPFAAVGILVLLALKVEFLVLGALLDATALGRFGSVARIFDAAMMAPMTLCVVFAPRFIQAQSQSVAALTQLYGQGVRVLLVVSVLLALLGVGLARTLTEQLLPAEYAGTGDLLRLLFFGLPGLSLHLFNVAMMLGYRTQTRPALLLTALVAAQVGVALLMVSAQGEQGAAKAMVISSTLAAVVSSIAVRAWLLDAFILRRAMLAPLVGLGLGLACVLAIGGLDGIWPALAVTLCFAIGAGLVMVLQRPSPLAAA
jgi:O-antigen/teichoic acid export membrane protein